jgi:hypothetical protein
LALDHRLPLDHLETHGVVVAANGLQRAPIQIRSPRPAVERGQVMAVPLRRTFVTDASAPSFFGCG